ncbi:MAG: hypothetical protein QG589_181 [Patescibacteria group bacterium]|nr:hypothetical protein [Patescibacteria group bacterium]
MRRLSKIAWVLIGVLFVAIVATAYMYSTTVFSSKSSATYQAVFLANGQVYFGKITSRKGDYIVLNNIYYLQAVQPIQGSSAESQPFSLVKLGKELHGPADVMYINKSQVLFYEDLRADSNVVKTIENSKIETNPTKTQ